MKYLIIYEPSQLSTFKAEDIHKTITNMQGLKDWWHYISNTYIVDSLKDETFIADYIIKEHPGLMFLVTSISLDNFNGVLKKSAWDWLNKKNKVQLKLKPTTQPPSDPFLDYLNIQSNKSESINFDQILDNIVKRDRK